MAYDQDAVAGRRTDQPQQETFLEATARKLNDSKQILYGITERLNSRGFYPGPTETRGPLTASGKLEELNTIRQEVQEQVEAIHDTVLQIKDQLDRLI